MIWQLALELQPLPASAKEAFEIGGAAFGVALTGSKFGPGLYDIVISLGKDEVKKRLESKVLT